MRIRNAIQLLEQTGPAAYSDEFMECLDIYLEECFYLLEDWAKEKITKAFDREMPLLHRSYAVYRGLSVKSWQDIGSAADFRNRTTIEIEPYMSTSLDRDLSYRRMEFGLDEGYGVFIMLKIKTKPGVRGIDVGEFKDKDEWYAMHAGEIILNRSSRFRVAAAEKKGSPFRGADWTHPYKAEWDDERMEYWEVELEQIK